MFKKFISLFVKFQKKPTPKQPQRSALAVCEKAFGKKEKWTFEQYRYFNLLSLNKEIGFNPYDLVF